MNNKAFKIALCLLFFGMLLFIFLWMHSSVKTPKPIQKPKENSVFLNEEREKEYKAIWLNYVELSLSESERNEKVFTEKIQKMFSAIRADGFNTVIVHIRPFCDAFYPSSYFPYSKYLSGTQGEPLPFDPLAILIETAHASHLSFEAWINPYRVSKDSDFTKLSQKHPVRIWHENGENQHIIELKEGIYLQPASETARTLILNGVRELVENYPIDAIHLDDYFYPSKEPCIDAAYFEAYQKAGGTLSLAEYRKENVNLLLSSMHTMLQTTAPHTELVISPSGNIAHNEQELFADVKRWGEESGYCDRLVPQLYYGFTNHQKPFEKTMQEWNAIVTNPSVSLSFGLAAYKCGTMQTKTAGDEAEWNTKGDVLTRQLQCCRSLAGYRGVAIYGYTNIYMTKDNKIMQKEWKNLKNVLQ